MTPTCELCTERARHIGALDGKPVQLCCGHHLELGKMPSKFHPCKGVQTSQSVG